METKERKTYRIPKRLVRRLEEIAKDQSDDKKKMSVNDIVIIALNDYVNRLDNSNLPLDLLNDRLNQLIVSQMNMTQILQQINNKIAEDD